jgi:hypothetical protein
MLRRIASILAIGLTIIPELAAQQSPSVPTVTIHKNQVLPFELTQPLDPKTAKVGDDVPLRLIRSYFAQGISVLPAGATAIAKVKKVKRPNPECPTGEVQLKLDRITFADQSTVKTKVWFMFSDKNFPVPPRYSKDNLDNPAAWIMLSPALAIALPFIAFHQAFHGQSCNPRMASVWPVHSEVAVRLIENHKVRY